MTKSTNTVRNFSEQYRQTLKNRIMTKSTNTVRNFSVVTIQSDTKEPHRDKINKMTVHAQQKLRSV